MIMDPIVSSSIPCQPSRPIAKRPGRSLIKSREYLNSVKTQSACKSLSVNVFSFLKSPPKHIYSTTTHPSPTNTPGSGGSTVVSHKVVIGVAVALTVAFIAAIVLFWRLYKRKKRRRKTEMVALEIAKDGNGDIGRANGT